LGGYRLAELLKKVYKSYEEKKSIIETKEKSTDFLKLIEFGQ
jgi:hypothetical protein